MKSKDLLKEPDWFVDLLKLYREGKYIEMNQGELEDRAGGRMILVEWLFSNGVRFLYKPHMMGKNVGHNTSTIALSKSYKFKPAEATTVEQHSEVEDFMTLFLLGARAAGWTPRGSTDYSFTFARQDDDFGDQVFNFYWNDKTDTYTVQTTLDHPKKGRTQLNRKDIELNQVLQLLINPRTHTGKGYRKKPKK